LSEICVALKPGKRSGSRQCPIHVVTRETLPEALKGLTKAQKTWLDIEEFSGHAGDFSLVQNEAGKLDCVLFGVKSLDKDHNNVSLAVGKLATLLPKGCYRFASGISNEADAVLAWMLSAYDFKHYSGSAKTWPQLAVGRQVDRRELRLISTGVNLARDLINTPANDMGPQQLESAIRKLARAHKATVSVIRGDNLLKKGFPLVHAVGRASDRAPRLIDMKWGKARAPKVTLVGKGVCFDTGGLNIKPGNSMALMKKDMGGAANTIGLAAMIMAAQLPVRLRLIIPAVENNISANAFRPGDVLPSRKGLSVEIGNTDAEGRLVLADALCLADEEKPDLLIDMATLTGAARVALGPDLPPFYCDDEDLVDEINNAAKNTADPLWQMPFWHRYEEWLDSKIADVNHISTGGFAGSMTAALFLRRFVEQAQAYVHFDIYGWAPAPLPGVPYGGAAQGIRALYTVIKSRYHKS
jgi:leucyl aminopeptidase